MSGLVWAVDAITRHCKHYKYQKRIIVICNQNTTCGDDLVASVTEQMQQMEIQLDFM
jgi:hypothetical protein